MRQITPQQSLALSFTKQKVFVNLNSKNKGEQSTFDRFVKQGEDQQTAIKRLMRSDKYVTKQKLPKRIFPAFVAGTTSTAGYVREYERINQLPDSILATGTHAPSPVPADDTVQFEEVNDYAEDLV